MSTVTGSEPKLAVTVPSVVETEKSTISGWIALVVGLAAIAAGIIVAKAGSGPTLVVVILIVVGAIILAGLTGVSPGEVRVLQLFGRYKGTVRTTGLRWVNPLTTRKRVSVRIRNHETPSSKVNDADGNPVEIAAVVVWQVREPALASFAVNSFVEFVNTQSETAVRHIANIYPYDNGGTDAMSLRTNTDDIAGQLAAEISTRVQPAGVDIVEARITRLAYAPEIAQVMLQRQQAGAVVAARSRIVEGAVGMVEMALKKLSDQGIVELDEERKAAMVSNLLVVLCGDRGTQPVVNTGSLYH
jgi:regulator of protease activity HflC (stomatin/prohibitin superfamily)